MEPPAPAQTPPLPATAAPPSGAPPPPLSSKVNFWERRWFKALYFFSFLVSFFTGVLYLTKEIRSYGREKQTTGTLLETDYELFNWEGFGRVFEPLVQLPVYYPQGNYQTETFLLDSGALVSSLPRETADKMGYSLAMLPRSTFSGYGNTTSFAYKANLTVLLGEEEIELPVVFTEAAGTKPILGRSGFFENYTVNFDAKEEKIRISK